MQYNFKAFKDFTRTGHGSSLRKGKRKLARPVATKLPMHLTLRASKAKGQWSMLRLAHFSRIQGIVYKHADRNNVRILQFANVGNHLHILIQAKTKLGFRAFLRTITGLVARLVTGAAKGREMGKFWDELAYSRIVTMGRDFKHTIRYVFQNAAEGFGVPTKRKPNAWSDPPAIFGAWITAPVAPTDR